MKRTAFDLHPRLLHLDITARSGLLQMMEGSYRSGFRGQGLEFDSYRSYSQDDDASRIDWKASRRTDQLLVKTYAEERNVCVFFLLDVSESMLNGSSQGKLKLEYAAEVIASIAYPVLKSDDAVGWGFFSKEVTVCRAPGRGMSRWYQLLGDLVDPTRYGGSADLSAAFERLQKNIPAGSVLIVVSDFINCGDRWEKPLKQFACKCDTIALVIHDVYDHTLPDDNAYLVLEHVKREEQMVVHAKSVKKAYEQEAHKFDESLKKTFLDCKTDVLHLGTTENYAKSILGFFEKRSKRWS